MLLSGAIVQELLNVVVIGAMVSEGNWFYPILFLLLILYLTDQMLETEWVLIWKNPG